MKTSTFLSMIAVSSLVAFFTPSSFAAEPVTLEQQLENLKLPENAAPSVVSAEKLYLVQNRYSSLRHRSEVTVGASKNFAGSSFIAMSQLDLSYRFHLNNRWNLSASGSYTFNELTSGAQELLNTKKIVPDAAYIKNRADFLVGYNLFYGKMRFSMERVAYFDIYMAAGPGRITTQFGPTTAAVVDAGAAIWVGRRWSARFGIKNSFFKEQRVLSTSNVYHMLGHLDLGVLFGGGA
jgi:outer membrane beta-barrel protein